MNDTVLTSIAVSGFTVAFFHAAIPTHWLPFSATGRALRWSHARTLAVTALAGAGHVLATAALGLLLTLFGVALSAEIGAWFPRIAGAVLIVLGLFFIWRQFSGHGHTHIFHPAHAHNRNEQEQERADSMTGCGAAGEHGIASTRTSDRAAIASLFALLTFSPCESFLPIYVSGIRFGWSGFALLTLILSAATVTGMIFFTWLTLAGIRNFRLRWFEQHDNAVMGAVLLLVGILIMFLEK
jgi:putative Mn2+ efflux pump MntP